MGNDKHEENADCLVPPVGVVGWKTPALPIHFLYSSIDVDIQTEKKTSAPSNLS